MQEIKAKISEQELNNLENLLDKTLGTKSKTGTISRSYDLKKERWTGGRRRTYEGKNGHATLQARLEGTQYYLELAVDFPPTLYTRFLAQCRTVSPSIYKRLRTPTDDPENEPAYP